MPRVNVGKFHRLSEAKVEPAVELDVPAVRNDFSIPAPVVQELTEPVVELESIAEVEEQPNIGSTPEPITKAPPVPSKPMPIVARDARDARNEMKNPDVAKKDVPVSIQPRGWSLFRVLKPGVESKSS